MVIAVVALLVIGPERLPEALRTLGLWFGRLRRTVTNLTSEIEKEIGMDDVRRQLHNEAVMEEMKRIEDEVKAANQSIMNSAPSNRWFVASRFAGSMIAMPLIVGGVRLVTLIVDPASVSGWRPTLRSVESTWPESTW